MALPTLRTTLLAMAVPTESRREDGRVRRRPGSPMLTIKGIKAIKKPGLYSDRGGCRCLYLRGYENLNKRWVARLVIKGERRDLGLGSYELVNLDEAREKALALRKTARNGGDPVADRRKAQPAPTFAEMARALHEVKQAEWKEGGKHADQWINTLTPTPSRSSASAGWTISMLRTCAPC
jgi:hypothetical protein